MLNYARVCVADDEDRERRRQREENGKALMLTKLFERLFGPVRTRRQTIGPEADPCEQSNERELMKGVGILDVLRRSEDRTP